MAGTEKIFRSMVEAKPKRKGNKSEPSGPQTGLDIAAALKEIQSSSLEQIQFETALKWGSRALAAYTLAARSGDNVERVLRFAEAEEFASEAKEHAAGSGDDGRLLQYLKQEIEQARKIALENVTQPAWR